MTATTTNPLDVWLRVCPTHDDDGDDHCTGCLTEAEANTFTTEHGYRVDWCLSMVGLVKSVDFDTLADAHDWLEREGFEDYTA